MNIEGVIYKIQKKDGKEHECYIGSTKNLKERIRRHKICLKTGHQQKIYRYIRDNGGIDNYNFEVLEKINLVNSSIKFLKEREQFYYTKYKPSMNMIRPYRSIECRRADDRIYYWKHRDKFLERKKQVFTCICGKKGIRSHFARHCRSIFHQEYLLKNKCIEVPASCVVVSDDKLDKLGTESTWINKGLD